MKRVFFIAGFLLCLVFAQPVSAQDTDATLEQRRALAVEMHKIRPTQDQVYTAIDQIANQQPEAEREAFRNAMRQILNYKAIEKFSIDAMVDTYTVEELEAMVEFHAKPEAQSALAKEQDYADKVYPEIIRMLDQALMRVRTGI